MLTSLTLMAEHAAEFQAQRNLVYILSYLALGPDEVKCWNDVVNHVVEPIGRAVQDFVSEMIFLELEADF